MVSGSYESKRLPSGSVLVIGAGLAGLYLALKLFPRKVYVLTSKRSSKGAASAWAQGGIAAALSKNDSVELHIKDTIKAGDGLVDPEIAKILASEGPSCVHDLSVLGVPFDKNSHGELSLSLEAAHSIARVARVKGDTTGAEIIKVMVARAQEAKHITGIIGWRAESLLTDINGGIAGTLARRDDGSLLSIEADITVLATGGIGGLFSVTTNPRTARGDALGMAAVVGAQMRDLEFVQFHPTAIDIGRDPAPLATEALRGKGAVLTDSNGIRFMDKYHKKGELAPRDDVARSIFLEIESGKQTFLDCRKAIGNKFPVDFPTVFESCMNAGIDPRNQLIPIAPAVHYHMGGIATDSYGQTNLNGLLAVGECSAVGVHGANRLASNSLLEAIVFGERAAIYINGKNWTEKVSQKIKSQPWLSMGKEISHSLRKSMTLNCGLQRNEKKLNMLINHINYLIEKVGPANPLVASKMIASSALARNECRGAHYRDDFNFTEKNAYSSYITYDMLD